MIEDARGDPTRSARRQAIRHGRTVHGFCAPRLSRSDTAGPLQRPLALPGRGRLGEEAHRTPTAPAQ